MVVQNFISRGIISRAKEGRLFEFDNWKELLIQKNSIFLEAVENKE